MVENHSRPTPDELLAHIQREESQQTRGKLKIFLGYAAGVGKTYAMLEAAHQRRVEGMDVVVAYVETHGRPETEALLEGLEVMPRRKVTYRGVTLTEMDVDAVLARRPQLALVDELAHTNAPGSRHTRRYHDVLELLHAGIDVYTTLNIQHIESLNDVVAQITGVIVRETVPDRVLDEASEIALIDLPIDELLQRLEEGKVYIPAQAAQAIRKFFRSGNLAALRELTLRRAADRIDEQMRAYMQTHAIPGPWPATERLLVCVSPSPLSKRLVRTARLLATRLNAEWFAVYVEMPNQARLSEADRNRVVQTLRLAEELGAKVVTIPGRSIAEAITSYAQKHNVTKIIAGKPLQSRWTELFRGSIVDQIIRHSPDIDVYVINSAGETTEARVATPVVSQPRGWQHYIQYLQSIALVALVTLLGLSIRTLIEPTNLVMFYLLAVVVAAVWWGHRAAILVSFLSVLTFDFFFVPPYHTLTVSDAEYLLTFTALLVVGVIICTLAAQARAQAQAAMHSAMQAVTLYEFSRDLAAAINIDGIIQAIETHISQTFGSNVVVWLPSGERLIPRPVNAGFALKEEEHSVASWVFRHGQPAGRGTDSLPGVDTYYLPLKRAQDVVGVLGVRLTGSDQQLTQEQRRLLESFASQAALAIKQIQLAEKARQAQLLHEAEKLQKALLDSISHELRTPLASMTGALSSLRDDAAILDETARHDLINMVYEQAERLDRLVGNLLDMTRLESGALKVQKEPCDVQDVIGVALSQLSNRLRDRSVSVQVPDDLPLVPMDFVLIVQVLVNLVDNALKYSPSDAPIEIRARLRDAEVAIEVSDHGMGIPKEELTRVFDKFYRVQRPNDAGGIGLGLSISKGIIEAHGGRIWAQNRLGGGTAIMLTLPLGKQDSVEEVL